MFDTAVAMITGAGLASAGWVVGFVSGRRRLPKERNPKPFCTCKHALSMHDPKTKACAAIDVESYWEWDDNVSEDVKKFKEFPCACKQYIGPLPVEQFFVTPMLPPT